MIYVLGLMAKSGHGKTTAARHLVRAFDAEIRPLAGPLKRAAQRVFGFSEEQLWGTQEEKQAIDPRYGFSPRWLLQRLGTEGLRDEFGEDIHLHALLHGLRKEERIRLSESGLGQQKPPPLYVVDDVRFPNDARFIAQGGPDFVGAVLKIIATDVPAPEHANHPSEIAIDAANAADLAGTVVSSRHQGVAHLTAAIDDALLRSPGFEVLRPALLRRH